MLVITVESNRQKQHREPSTPEYLQLYKHTTVESVRNAKHPSVLLLVPVFSHQVGRGQTLTEHTWGKSPKSFSSCDSSLVSSGLLRIDIYGRNCYIKSY